MNSLIPRYRAMVQDKGAWFFGLSVLQHEASIRKMRESLSARSMLDYGCGRGDAYAPPHDLHTRIGVPLDGIRLYDPAFAQHDDPPAGEFDLVVCSDVVEHVPEGEVDDFIDTLFRHARRGVWASVCCRPAKKSFEDGMNLHVTVKPYMWWSMRFSAAAAKKPGVNWTLIETL